MFVNTQFYSSKFAKIKYYIYFCIEKEAYNFQTNNYKDERQDY